ncbi:MAG TPA: homoserine kinase [Longimicrobiales bacterium]|nr:homoserine kinase [Longimicrobiales bacterium]
MSGALRRARVRVPCSTSNLGSGYDTIGLALDRYLEATFTPTDADGLELVREGTLAGLSISDGPDLVAETFRGELARAGIEARGVLSLTSTIPVARGLGSSAAGMLAAYDLARAVRGLPRADEEAFEKTLAREGHGDNAAPCLYGGLCAVAHTPDGTAVIELPLSESVGFAYAAPAAGLTTESARGALPAKVPHKSAALALGRLAALIRGLAEGSAELIAIGVHDELHVPYRLPLIPGAVDAMAAASDAGAWAVTISGAGSGLIAICDPERAPAVAEAMRVVLDAGEGNPECVGFAVRPDFGGLRRLLPT